VSGAKAIPFTFQTAIISLVFLTLLVLPKHYKQLINLDRKIIYGLLVASAVHFGLGGFFSNSGISLTSAINSGFLVKFALVTTTLLAWPMLGEKMTRTKLATIVIILIGSYLISTKGETLIPQIGDILIILACLSWSLGNILVKKTLKNHHVSGEIAAFLRPIAGIPVLLVLTFISPLYPQAIRNMFVISHLDFRFWPYALATGLMLALLWIFLNRTLKLASASYMTMMSSITPILVSILAIIILKETLVPIQTLGAIMIIGAASLTQFSKV
jgi:drug/metabolite transporter (DMT)-like permease